MMKKGTLLLFACVVLLMAGCMGESMTADTLPWVSDAPILFADDFSHQSGGWQTHEDSLSYIGYAQDGFRLWLDLPNYQVWSVPGLNFKDTHIYTRVHKLAGPNDNFLGMVCRFQDEENYYAFLISSGVGRECR